MTQMTNIMNKRGDIIIMLQKKWTIREYCEQLYVNKLCDHSEIGKFLERQLLKLIQEEIENLSRLTTSDWVNTQRKKSWFP